MAQKRRPPGTLNALEKALGISKRRVSDLLKQGMPEDPAAALEWREDRCDGDNSTAALRKERIKLLRIQQKRAQLELDREAGKVWSYEEAKSSAIRCAVLVRTKFMKLALNDAPPTLAGLSEVGVSKRLEELVRGVLEELYREAVGGHDTWEGLFARVGEMLEERHEEFEKLRTEVTDD